MNTWPGILPGHFAGAFCRAFCRAFCPAFCRAFCRGILPGSLPGMLPGIFPGILPGILPGNYINFPVIFFDRQNGKVKNCSSTPNRVLPNLKENSRIGFKGFRFLGTLRLRKHRVYNMDTAGNLILFMNLVL